MGAALRQVHDLYDYEGQPFLLGHQNEAKIRKEGLKKGDFDFKKIIGVSMFGHVTMAKHKVRAPLHRASPERPDAGSAGW